MIEQKVSQKLEIKDIENDDKCGCYAINADLLEKNPGKQLLVPLKSIEYQIQIANSITNVQLTQTYFNPTDQFLQVQFSFPKSSSACVYLFEAKFGKTLIQGIVKEKQEAKKEYEQAVASGKRAVYGETDKRSKDILNLKIGNISPEDTVTIKIAYLQELTLSLNQFYRFHLMGTISPRYCNYIPQEQIINGFNKQITSVEGSFHWNFIIRLKTAQRINFFKSKNQEIKILEKNEHQTDYVLTLAKPELPNKDFILLYTTQKCDEPSCVVGQKSALISFIPKFCPLSVDDAYKEYLKQSKLELDVDHGKGEYIFLLDRSGSMDGSRIENAKKALVLFIKSLPEDTYFNVVSFGSGYDLLFKDGSVRYDDEKTKLAVNQINQMSADMGGTEILDPLRHILATNLIEGYPKHIFLLTDGGVSDTAQVIQTVKRNTKFSRVHTIGIGNGASQALIKGCAQKGKGYSVFIDDQEEPSQKIIQLLTDSLSPVISNIKLQYDPEVIQSIIPNPQKLPYILKNQIVNFYITFKDQFKHISHDVLLKYEDSLNKIPYSVKIQINPNAQTIPFINKMAHFKQITALEDAHNDEDNVEDFMYYVKVVDKKAKAIQLSINHQILSQFTSFVCIEKELIDGKYDEIKQKGQRTIIIEQIKPIEYQNQMIYCSQPIALSCAYSSGIGYEDECAIQSYQQQQMSFNNKEGCGNINYMDQMQQEAQMKQQIAKQQAKSKESDSISEVISMQSSDGSWKDEKLYLLFHQLKQQQINQSPDKIFILTFLIVRWIEKNFPQKQYALIIKKGLNFLKKKGINLQQYETKYPL